MTTLQAFILGIIQGITEFLPISSSGHLVLAPNMLHWQLPEEQVFVFDVLVQLGTLLAVIVYYRRDLWAILRALVVAVKDPSQRNTPETRLGIYLVLASIPAGIGGLLLKNTVEAAFGSPKATAVFLIFTALMLLFAEQAGKRALTLDRIGWQDALWIGAFQILALFPGVSRSGSTITGGMVRNLERPAAARFSFLMSVPIMIAASGLAALDLRYVPDLNAFLLPMFVGFITAAISGYLAIRWLIGYLASHPMYYFSIYLIALGTLYLVIK